MKKLALVALAACGGGSAVPPTPDVLTWALTPGSKLPACVGEERTGCRSDGFADLDDDGALDCWRITNGSTLLWPGCTGDAIRIGHVEHVRTTLTLPVAQRTPAWAQAIASAWSASNPPTPAVRAWMERMALPDEDSLRRATTLAWTPGTPGFPAPASAILDDGSIVLYAPAWDVVPADRKLVKVATCAPWEIWTGPHVTAVADTRNGTWTMLDREGGGEAICADGLVFTPAYAGTDGQVLTATDPGTGRAMTFGTGGSGWRSALDDDGISVAWDGRMTFAQVRALLATPTVPGSCDVTAGTPPLLQFAPPAPCTLERSCMRASYVGTPLGAIHWTIGTAEECPGAFNLHILMGVVVNVVNWSTPELDAAGQRGLAELLTGSHQLACIPARRGCGRADPALIWMHDRLVHYGGPGDGSGSTPTVWQRGTPAFPPPSVALVRDIPLHTGPGIGSMLVYTGAMAAPLVEQATCDRWQVWSSAGGGAVVDRSTGRWAWAYLASSNDPQYQRDRPAAVGRGWCEDDLAFFELAPDRVVVTDPSRGTWSILTRDEWAWVEDRPDHLVVLGKVLAAARAGDDLALVPPP